MREELLLGGANERAGKAQCSPNRYDGGNGGLEVWLRGAVRREAKELAVDDATEGMLGMVGGRRKDEMGVGVLREEGEPKLVYGEADVQVEEVNFLAVVQGKADIRVLRVQMGVKLQQGSTAVWPNTEDVVLVALPNPGPQWITVEGLCLPRSHVEVGEGPAKGVAHGNAARLEPDAFLKGEDVRGKDSA